MKLEEDNDIHALLKIGEFYYRGLVVEIDYNKAREYFGRVISTNDGKSHIIDNDIVKAYEYLADIYMFGNGVEEDPKEAFMFCKLAAENGYPDAQYRLAMCYLNGIGIDKDLDKYKHWLRQAAMNGNNEALELMKKGMKE